MREIKYRAWDKKNKLYIVLQGFVLDEDCIHLWWNYGTRQMFDEEFPSNQIILEQYTGLKDKNGKEIYEGDSVRFYWTEDKGYSDKESGGFTEMVDHVIFDKGCFYFVNDDVGGGAYAFRHTEYCEIIGNIHEGKSNEESV